MVSRRVQHGNIYSVPSVGLAPLPDSLLGVQLKVERAEEHYAALDAAVVEFLGSQPYRLVVEVSSDGLEHTYRVADVRQPGAALSVFIGDCLHNYRSALDHLVWQLVLANAGTPSRRNEFPIFLERDQFKLHARKKLAGVAPAAAAVIEGFQPYQRPDLGAALRHPLWALHELDIQDKHRLLLFTLATMTGGGGYVPQGLVDKDWHAGPISDGTVVIRHSFAEPVPADLRQLLFVDVALEAPWPPTPTGPPMLRYLLQLIRWQTVEVVNDLALLV